MNEVSKQTKIQHLFWRAGFGASPQQVREALEKPIAEIVDGLFRDSRQDSPLEPISAAEQQHF